jgi:O-antigen/teichoic acid export membrane protein
VKFVAEHNTRGEFRELRSLVTTALWLHCFLGAVALLLTLLICPLLPSLFNVPSSESGTITAVGFFMGAQLAISIAGSTPSAVLSGLQRYDLKNAISVIWTVFSAAATVAVLLAGGGVVEIAAVTTLIALIMHAAYILCLNRVAPHLRFTFRGARRELVRRILSFSTSMLVIDISTSLQTKSDEIVIGAFLPVSFVSPYSLARRLSSIPQMIADRFLWGFVPVTSQLQAQGEAARLRALYLSGTRITLALCLPFAAVVIILAGPLLTLWLGERYAEYAPITVVLTIASVLEVSCWPGGTILLGLGRHHGLAAIAACAAIANLTLSILLVRPYGLFGVAIGTLLPAAIVTFGWKLSFCMRILRVSPREMLTQGLLPVLWPFLFVLVLLEILKSVTDLSGLVSIGCAAAVGIGAFSITYLGLFSGDSERQLIRNTVAAIKQGLYAAER